MGVLFAIIGRTHPIRCRAMPPSSTQSPTHTSISPRREFKPPPPSPKYQPFCDASGPHAGPVEDTAPRTHSFFGNERPPTKRCPKTSRISKGEAQCNSDLRSNQKGEATIQETKQRRTRKHSAVASSAKRGSSDEDDAMPNQATHPQPRRNQRAQSEANNDVDKCERKKQGNGITDEAVGRRKPQQKTKWY